METKTHINALYRFSSYLKPHWKKIGLSGLLMLLTVIMQIPRPFIIQYVIDEVVAVGSYRLLTMAGLVIIGVLIVGEVAVSVQSYIFILVRTKVMKTIRLALFAHIQLLPLTYLGKKETGKLLSRLTGDVTATHGLLADTIIAFVQNIFIFIAGIACTFYIHPGLSGICLLLLSLYVVSLKIFSSRMRTMSYDVRQRYELVHKDLQEMLLAIPTVRLFSAERYSIARLCKSLRHVMSGEIKHNMIATLATVSSTTISSLGPIALIWYGCAEIIRGDLTIGGLMAFNSFVSYIFGPASNLFSLNVSIQRSLAACMRLFEILDITTERSGIEPITIRHGKLEFDKVTFKYDDTTVLKQVSFSVNPGQVCGIVGPSGAGKTTLGMLVPRLFEVDGGRILIDGKDIRDVRLDQLRKEIGIISQDTFLLSDTLSENVALGRPSAHRKDIEYACYLAGCDFIRQLPDGYQTRVGERGERLSGGQRQRISIARTILADPRIVIFDEATANLDPELEQRILNMLRSWMTKRTTLIITHRLSTVKNADQIIVLEGGGIVEQGEHEQLWKDNGVYRRLWANCDI